MKISAQAFLITWGRPSKFYQRADFHTLCRIFNNESDRWLVQASSHGNRLRDTALECWARFARPDGTIVAIETAVALSGKMPSCEVSFRAMQHFREFLEFMFF